ncbi:unnamed protein product [Prunus brigantina]
MNAVLRILRYLKSAPGKRLTFSKHGHLNIDGYIDADWAGSITDRKSTSGYFTLVGGNLVTWRSKKHKVVALSNNPVQHDCAKHVEVDRHYIKEKLEAKVIQFPFVKSDDQLADILTNAISSKAFHNSLN